LGLLYIYTWKFHKETSCVVVFISNKQKCHFQFFFSVFFLFYKDREQEGRTWLVQEGGLTLVEAVM
jgi:hypothetical protein